MELYLLDDNFQYITPPIDDYLSLSWTDRYAEAGEFSLTLSPDMARDALQAAYVYNSERGVMEITGVTYSAVGRRSLTLSGRGLLWLLDRRIITASSNSVSDAAGTVIRNRVTAETAGSRALPLPLTYDVSEASDSVTANFEFGENLYSWVVDILNRMEYGASIDYDAVTAQLNLRVYKGKNRTQQQSANSRAIFSQSFGNIRRLELRRYAQDYRNVCYGDNDTAYPYILDDSAGNPRRETVTNISNGWSDSRKKAECQSVLVQYKQVDAVSGEADHIDMIYGMDYNVGDICNIVDDTIGLTVSLRITQVTTVYEQGAVKITPVFGERMLNLREFIKREAR